MIMSCTCAHKTPRAQCEQVPSAHPIVALWQCARRARARPLRFGLGLTVVPVCRHATCLQAMADARVLRALVLALCCALLMGLQAAAQPTIIKCEGDERRRGQICWTRATQTRRDFCAGSDRCVWAIRRIRGRLQWVGVCRRRGRVVFKCAPPGGAHAASRRSQIVKLWHPCIGTCGGLKAADNTTMLPMLRNNLVRVPGQVRRAARRL